MKILLITNNFPPKIGGIAVFLENLFNEITDFGNIIHLLVPETIGCCDENINAKYTITAYPVMRRFSSVLPVIKTIMIYFKEKQDIIFIGTFMPTHALGAVLLKKIFKVPYVILVHGFDLEDSFQINRKANLFSKYFLLNASFVYVNSNFTKKTVVAKGYNETKVGVLNPGVDPEIFKPNGSVHEIREKYNLNNKRVLLTVTRLIKRKAHDRVIVAMREIIKQYPDLVYIIVGEGPEEENLKKLTKRLRLDKHVIFAGKLPNNGLPALYCACNIFIMLSGKDVERRGDTETFGIVFLEANSCMKPVIGGNVGGIPDAVIDNYNGLLVDPNKPEELKNAIIKLLSDRNLADKLGRNGRERIEREFNWKNIAKKLNDQLVYLVEKGRDYCG